MPDNNGEDDLLGDTEFDAEMVSKVREKLKRTAEDKQTEGITSKDSVEDVFSYNRSKKRKLVYGYKECADVDRRIPQGMLTR